MADYDDTYPEWLGRKSRLTGFRGVDALRLAANLFPHQRDLVRWSLRKGRAAIFADTGLGKTMMQLAWAENVARQGRVLILAPLAVAAQTVREGERFGIECRYLQVDSMDPDHKIVVTNYERLASFDPADFVGVVLDESSILKSFNGKTRNAIISGFANTPYRLACTATPAPNDFTELGNHAEFLGVRTRTEMLAEFFVHDGGSTQDWRIKGHAVGPFWSWVSTWGAIVRSPADLGHDASDYQLPPLEMVEHVIPVNHADSWAKGYLFAPEAASLSDSRAARRNTLQGRVEKTIELIEQAEGRPVIVWCELNQEQNELAKRLGNAAFSVQGSDTAESKETQVLFWIRGKRPVLLSKPRIVGFGLNFQHCADMVFVGASYSYEQTYQAIRRCWRYGQTRSVKVHVLRAENEANVIETYRRKERDAETLASEMTTRVRDSVLAEVTGKTPSRWNEYSPRRRVEIPKWML